jgi:hypothetical protein
VALIVPLYAIVTKSSSDRAATVSKKVDAEVPATAPVEIVTPGAAPISSFLPTRRNWQQVALNPQILGISELFTRVYDIG